MKINKISIFIFLLSLLLISSESIEDNEYYKKGVELLNLAKYEYNNGDYDKGYEYSEQAKDFFIKAHQYNLIRILTLRLNKERDNASSYIEKTKTSGLNNNENSAKLYNDAIKSFDEGETYYNEGTGKDDYTEKGDLFQKAIDKYIETTKLCEMALTNSSTGKDDAQKLIQQAKIRRDSMIKSKIITKNDNDDKSVMNLINESQNYLDKKDYNASIKKSNDAIALMDKIQNKKDALTLLIKAKDLYSKAKNKGAENDFPDKFKEAGNKLAASDNYYNNSNFNESIKNSNEVIDIINSFNYKFGATFPKYYKVRKLRPTADCFWKIAGYSFIYNDIRKWRIIYEANKDKLENIDNPNLIQPEMIFIIPSIKGEEREGEYDPSKQYPVFKK
jgi:HEPN domain-containing protein